MGGNYFNVAFPAFVLLGGSVAALLVTMGKEGHSALEHFAGGVVLSAVFLELLPSLLEVDADKQDPPLIAVIGGFALGVAFLHFMRQIFPEEEEEDDEEDYQQLSDEQPAIPGRMVAGEAVEIMCSGLVIGMSWEISDTAGLVVTLAMSLQMFVLGLSTIQGLAAKNIDTMRSFIVIFGLAVILYLGGVLGMALLSLFGTGKFFATIIFSFGIATALWSVVEELLLFAPTASKEDGDDEKKWCLVMTFVGFIVPMVVDRYASV